MIWVTMFAAGLLTFLMRLSFIWLFGRLELPGWLMRALSYVPVAVFCAIIFPEVLAPGGELSLAFSNPRLPAAMAAVLVAWKTHNVVWVVAVGMAVLWLLSFWFG